MRIGQICQQNNFSTVVLRSNLFESPNISSYDTNSLWWSFFSKSWYWSFEKWSQCKLFLCFLSHFANSDLPMKIDVFWFKSHQKLFPRAQSTTNSHWCLVPISHYLSQWWSRFPDESTGRHVTATQHVVNMRYVIMAEECPWKQGCADIKTFVIYVVNIKDIVDQKSEQIIRQKTDVHRKLNSFSPGDLGGILDKSCSG